MARKTLNDLLRIQAKLRAPGGCPWDRKQTHKTLLKHLREESDEVAQAIRKGDMDNLKEELGDLLHQIIFHAQIAREKGLFTMADVVDELCRKIVRRHPHVFGKSKVKSVKDVLVQWDEIKRQEKITKARRLARTQK